MSFISFNYNKNLIYAIIYWALEIINRIIMYFEWGYFELFEKDSINQYFFVLLYNISDLLAGFLVLYINCSLKKKQKPKVESGENKSFFNNIEIISGGEKRVHHSKNFIYEIILICLLDYISRSNYFIFYQIYQEATYENVSQKAQKDIIINSDIISRYILSIFFQKTKVFKHHKFSIIIISIGFLFLIPTDIISIHYFTSGINEGLSYIYIAITFLRVILFPFEDVIVKKVFTDDYVIPELLMFLRGIGEFILILIITPIFYFFVWKNENNNFVFKNELTNAILMIIFYTLSSFIKAYVLLKVIYYFSSQSVSFLIISESITGSIYEIIKFFMSEKYDYKIIILLIEIVIIIITTFGTLIYDEIIVIRKWGLDKNVAKEIILRGESEINSIGLIVDEDEEDDEEEKNNNILLENVYE